MRTSFPRSVVVDSGFWIALFDETDPYHAIAAQRASLLNERSVLLPWPTLYEFINTRFCKRRTRMDEIERILQRPHVVRICDLAYREEALKQTLFLARTSKRSISLVDMVVRLILDDRNVRKHGLLTNNAKDFYDVCQSRGIELIDLSKQAPMGV